MTKTPVPLRVNDMTGFTRSLSQQLGETSPSHLTLMNIVARAAGFQNVQHMRAASAAARRLEDAPGDIIADARAVERRTMISCGLLTRQVDGTDYRRVEQKPPTEAKAIIRELSARRSTRSTGKTEMQNA